MPAGCQVCNHKDVTEINRDMVLHAMSVRKVADKYDIKYTAISRHRPHITQKLALAQERREHLAADRLLDDTEMLWRESLDVLEHSKKSVKTQGITEGTGKNTRVAYREYKDLAPVMSALKVCHDNRKLFGEASGVLPANQTGGQTGIFLSISMPRMEGPAPTEGPIIEATIVKKSVPKPPQDPNIPSPLSARPDPKPHAPKIPRSQVIKAKFMKTLNPRVRAATEKAQQT